MYPRKTSKVWVNYAKQGDGKASAGISGPKHFKAQQVHHEDESDGEQPDKTSDLKGEINKLAAEVAALQNAINAFEQIAGRANTAVCEGMAKTLAERKDQLSNLRAWAKVSRDTQNAKLDRTRQKKKTLGEAIDKLQA